MRPHRISAVKQLSVWLPPLQLPTPSTRYSLAHVSITLHLGDVAALHGCDCCAIALADALTLWFAETQVRLAWSPVTSTCMSCLSWVQRALCSKYISYFRIVGQR